MKTRLLTVLFLFILWWPIHGHTGNPFLGQGPPPTAPSLTRTDQEQRSFLYKINMLQKQYREKMTELGIKLKTAPSLKLWMTLLGISFLYGILHAAGPGHGKVIAASYFLNSPVKITHPLIYGATFAFLHSFSAIILIIIIHFFLKIPLLSSLSGTENIAMMLSYFLLLCIGIWLLIKVFSKKPVQEQQYSMSGLFFISAVSGMVPCPGALIILVFSISIDSMRFGILSVLSMTLGMMITVSLISMFVMIGKHSFLASFSKNKPGYGLTKKIFSFTGAMLIIALSATFLLGSLL